ncbi:protein DETOXIFICATION 42 [Dendrobium catenatum]|uniref:Protein DETOXIFICATION n=1 Tax=Dendrobium catenatum TaxID=906689 RepID=A0A2I0WFE3_9ASPA|nr:protein DETOXIFICATION 42 [Dendrobium catenatum]PKU74380.1 MATE efflux family protein 1 [Dendrobium catenatum]
MFLAFEYIWSNLAGCFDCLMAMGSLSHFLLPDSAAPSMSEGRTECPLRVFFKDARSAFKKDELGLEIVQIALPAALALMADPIASLIDTAFIGQIGPLELAAVGVSIAVFNQVSRVAIFPLVGVTTSFVAEEDATCKMADEELEVGNFKFPSETKELIPHNDSNERANSLSFSSDMSTNSAKIESERKNIPSVSTALVIGGILGLLQTMLLVFCARPILTFMGVKHDSPMMTPASQYLTLRSLGAPANVLSMAMQGVFRGFKDTKTPLYATVAGDATNIILDPIFMFVFHLGVSGAAIAHVISQYLIALILLWKLLRRVEVLPPSISDLQFHRFLKNGFLLLTRVIAVTFCITLSASKAARMGSIPMAAFQICLQVWLTISLLADGLAVAGQAILASAFARKDYQKAASAASRVLQWAVILGLFLCALLGGGLQFASKLFTKDAEVLHLIHIAIPFVALSQPINALAFCFDGINFGASDFAYSAYSLVMVAIASVLCIIFLSSSYGFIGIWVALTIYMSLRFFAGLFRIGTARGPWTFLRTFR